MSERGPRRWCHRHCGGAGFHVGGASHASTHSTTHNMPSLPRRVPNSFAAAAQHLQCRHNAHRRSTQARTVSPFGCTTTFVPISLLMSGRMRTNTLTASEDSPAIVPVDAPWRDAQAGNVTPQAASGSSTVQHRGAGTSVPGLHARSPQPTAAPYYTPGYHPGARPAGAV